MTDVYYISGESQGNRGGVEAFLLDEDQARQKKDLFRKMQKRRKRIIELSADIGKSGEVERLKRELEDLEARYRAIVSTKVTVKHHPGSVKVGDLYTVKRFKKKFYN